ncbi:hypothetical protein MSG28_012210 [Choristoneura fumiferana]|uniref:Uncharacterized protein n=1 Tax=Choristoneura fumiferana TaxID=7141 RepID=A0ACC0KCX1_CHOFU|nr:hypothetical protein MSG28_012210 [Choristoneura fumiferana]
MNTTDRYPATASLFMLREIKRRQELVHRGHELLKRKTEALRFRGRQTASDLSITQGILGHTLREAYISLAAIKFTNGESNALVLENIGQNISGVATVSLQAIEESGISDSLRYAGLGAGGHRTGEAKKAFREAVHILIKFASLRNTLNGIEKVIMPKLHNTENYIQMEMAEREREELHRLKMVKAKKIRAKALAKLRLEHPESGGSGESSEVASSRSASRIRSIECLTSILYTCNSPLSSTTDSAGDYSSYKPTCCPPGWDDEDLLF